jgi:hypothetical protein
VAPSLILKIGGFAASTATGPPSYKEGAAMDSFCRTISLTGVSFAFLAVAPSAAADLPPVCPVPVGCREAQ